ncbi:MAG: LysR family transcriptional regulator [Myxococcota bacterium]
MQLRLLRSLLAVAEHGTITGAARALGIAQPTLSANIRRLEGELGTPMLHRHARGVSLTAAGELVLANATPVLQRIDELPQQVRALTDGLSGRFVLGCYHSLGAWYLPSVFRQLLQRYPDIDLQVHAARSADVHQAVIDRECDLGLVVNALPHPDLIVTAVSSDAITVVTSASHCERFPDPTAALAAGPLFYLDQEPFTILLQRLAARELLPTRCVPLGDLELIKALVVSGVGLAFLPLRVARYGTTNLQILDLDLPRFDDTIHLIMRFDTPRVRALRALRAVIAEVGGAFPEPTAGLMPPR